MKKIRTMVTAVAALGTIGIASAEKINVYAWSQSIEPKILEKFTKETGIEVVVDGYTSNEELLSKLKAGGTNYDIAFPSQHFVKIMIGEGLLLPINAKNEPAYNNIKDEYKGRWWDPDNMYSVPFAYGSAGFTVNRDHYKGPVDSWSVFFNPPAELKGKIAVFAAPDEVIPAAQNYLGIEYCTESSDDMKKVYNLLKAQKGSVAVYTNDNIRDRLASGEVYATSWWDGESIKARTKSNLNVEYAMPKEGLVGWVDSAVIPQGATNIDGAKKFINFMSQKAIATEWSNMYGHDFAIKLDVAKLTANPTNAPEIYPTVPVKMSKACSPAAQKLVDKVWTSLMQ